MGQKVNPISLRLQKTNRHFDSCWYDDYNYTHLLLQDYKIKNYLKTVLHQIKYPEGRILNSGLPKKNSCNIFYYNPTNSRRKKSFQFQLQNFKEKVKSNKDNKKGFFRQKKTLKDIYRFFSFPEQQYWKNGTFTLPHTLSQTLPQKQIKELPLTNRRFVDAPLSNGNIKVASKQIHSKLIRRIEANPERMLDQYKNRSKRKDNNLLSFFSLSNPRENLFLFNNFNKKATKSVLTNLKHPEKVSGLVSQGNEKAKETGCKSSSVMLASTNRYLKFPKVYSDKNSSSLPFFSLYLNKLLLEFVTKNKKAKDIQNGSKSLLGFASHEVHTKRETGKNTFSVKNLESKRFFVRYLFAQLYCNYLENKEIYNVENLSTLYRFLVFFIEKNVKNGFFLKKYRSFKENNEFVPKTNIYQDQKVPYFGFGKAFPEKKSPFLPTFFPSSAHEISHTPKQPLQSVAGSKSLVLGAKQIALDTNLTSYTFKDSQTSLCDVREFLISLTSQSDVWEIKESVKSLVLSSICNKESVRCLNGGFFKKNQSTFQAKKNHPLYITESDVKAKKSSFFDGRSCFAPGVYSSNLVYKSHLEFSLSKQYSSFFNINLFRTLIEKQSASFLVQEIIYYLERKIPFRRIKTQILKEIPHYENIKGIRIKCSGRVGGRSKKAQRSKTQSVKIGQTSLGVFSSKIDFACKSAYTRFGLIGVKVWVCYY